MANRKLASEISKSGLLQRYIHKKVTDESGLTAYPQFTEYSMGAIEHLLDISIGKDELIAKIATPENWKCDRFIGKTYEEAFNKAKKVKLQIEKTDRTGLNRLTGTEKQVAWANKIRSDFSTKYPNAKILKNKFSASYWIENRDSLDNK